MLGRWGYRIDVVRCIHICMRECVNTDIMIMVRYFITILVNTRFYLADRFLVCQIFSTLTWTVIFIRMSTRLCIGVA